MVTYSSLHQTLWKQYQGIWVWFLLPARVVRAFTGLMLKSLLSTEEQGRGGREQDNEGGGEGHSSKNTSWINKSNQWLCAHLKVSGRLKQNRLKLWNICQQGWANTVRIITEEMSAAVGPRRPLSDRLDSHSNCCFLEIKDPIAELWFLAEGRYVYLWGQSSEKRPSGSFFVLFLFE